MSDKNNLSGKLVISHPKCSDPFFAKGVVLIAKHTPTSAWGLMVNKPTPRLRLDQIMQSVGLMSDISDRVYVGGPVDTNRVNVVHTLDWRSSTTLMITDDIGITSDVGVLVAIADGVGPSLYRACLGTCSWDAGQLDKEFKAEYPWRQEDSWIDSPATIDSVFDQSEEEQWNRSIELAAQSKIANWL